MQYNGNTLLTMIKSLVTTKFAHSMCLKNLTINNNNTIHNNVNMFCLFLYNLLTSIDMPETVEEL